MSEVTQSPEQTEQADVEAGIALANADLIQLDADGNPIIVEGNEDGTTEVSDSGASGDDETTNAVDAVPA